MPKNRVVWMWVIVAHPFPVYERNCQRADIVTIQLKNPVLRRLFQRGFLQSQLVVGMVMGSPHRPEPWISEESYIRNVSIGDVSGYVEDAHYFALKYNLYHMHQVRVKPHSHLVSVRVALQHFFFFISLDSPQSFPVFWPSAFQAMLSGMPCLFLWVEKILQSVLHS